MCVCVCVCVCVCCKVVLNDNVFCAHVGVAVINEMNEVKLIIENVMFRDLHGKK